VGWRRGRILQGGQYGILFVSEKCVFLQIIVSKKAKEECLNKLNNISFIAEGKIPSSDAERSRPLRIVHSL
jgi:hypothetical protein